MINPRYLSFALFLFVAISTISGAMTGLTRASSFSPQVHNALGAEEKAKPAEENAPMNK